VTYANYDPKQLPNFSPAGLASTGVR